MRGNGRVFLGGKKLDLGYILKKYLIGFVNVLDVGFEGKEKVKDDFKYVVRK